MMHRKKRHEKKRPLEILSASDEALVASLVESAMISAPEDLAARIPDARVALALVERLPLDHPGVVPILAAIDEKIHDKKVHKAVSRALFTLKTRGIFVERAAGERDSSPSILRPVQRESSSAYVGTMDMSGTRVVFLYLYRSPVGVDVASGIVSDELGILQFNHGNMSKKQAKEIRETLHQDMGPLVETSLSHAFWILESAYACHTELNTEAPAQYLDLRPYLKETVPPLERPMVYSVLPEMESMEDILTEENLERLFQRPLMGLWLMNDEAIEPCVKEIRGVEESPLLLNDLQKAERVGEIKEKHLGLLFPEAKRVLLHQRLEEMAYVFCRTGDEDMARLALRAAKAAGTQTDMLRRNPVMNFLFERSLRIALGEGGKETSLEGGETEDEEPSRIIVP